VSSRALSLYPLTNSLSVRSTRLCCIKTAERIDVLFGVETPRNKKHSVRWGSLFPPTARGWGFDADFAKLLGPVAAAVGDDDDDVAVCVG